MLAVQTAVMEGGKGEVLPALDGCRVARAEGHFQAMLRIVSTVLVATYDMQLSQCAKHQEMREGLREREREIPSLPCH